MGDDAEGPMAKDTSPTIVAEKIPRPTLWVDTFVLVKLAKLRQGEQLGDLEKARLERLRDLVPKLVAEDRLLLPQADQEDEYKSGRLAPEIDAEWARLSLGVRMNHRLGIEDKHVDLAVRAYCEEREEITIPWNSYFHSDPFDTLNQNRDLGFVVDVDFPMGDEYWKQKETAKLQVRVQWENIRQGNRTDGLSYEEWLPEELNGQSKVLLTFIERHERRERSGIRSVWTDAEYVGTQLRLELWKELGGRPPGAEGLAQCLGSEYYTRIPTWKIKAQLCADLVTGEQPIRSGDAMDVGMLAVAIPECHYVLCDRTMADRIRRRGIEEEWRTSIYTMRTIDDLFAELESLPGPINGVKRKRSRKAK